MKRTRTFIAAATLAGAVAIAPGAHALPAETTAATGETYYLNTEGTHYVPSKEAADTPFEQLDKGTRESSVPVDGAADAGLVDAPAPAPAGAPAETPLSPEDVNPESGAPVAAGLISLPSVFTVEGTTYYLNQDGKTYVTDMARIDAEPTPEEVEASNALLEQHGAEAGRQGIAEARAGGEAPAVEVTRTAAAADPAPRGIGAETGENAVAAGLAAFLVASVIGAAVFAYGRRRLI
ncbi:hypothetical protein [Corynebacterium timonense]|uniref:Uncharacterized protein n=1 Tax=Corynebacterium timonense TaxID=441500 RepID=A0A1H1L3H1_9CORY|nr:hypothetical protein [Corynebacterium timonense]SDR69108.1 hypothetical protein SAMN04488539_0047 [Corynebacterium timonense]